MSLEYFSLNDLQSFKMQVHYGMPRPGGYMDRGNCGKAVIEFKVGDIYERIKTKLVKNPSFHPMHREYYFSEPYIVKVIGFQYGYPYDEEWEEPCSVRIIFQYMGEYKDGIYIDCSNKKNCFSFGLVPPQLEASNYFDSVGNDGHFFVRKLDNLPNQSLDSGTMITPIETNS